MLDSRKITKSQKSPFKRKEGVFPSIWNKMNCNYVYCNLCLDIFICVNENLYSIQLPFN